jgi:uncharacterized Zn finger protein
MDLLVVCAQCSTEFKVSGDEPVWKCTKCGHLVENRKYPFLTRKIAHAKSQRAETDWEAMFDELLADARQRVLTLEARVAKLEEENGKLKGRRGGAPKEKAP